MAFPPMPPPIRLAIAEDHPVLRDRLVRQLAFFDAVDLVLVAESGDELLAAFDVRERTGAPAPDVVLMDIEMPGTNGIDTTARLRERWPATEVLMLTVFEEEARIFAAIQAGASGYLLKDAGPDAVVQAVREVAAGGAPTSPLVARKLLHYVQQREDEATRRSTDNEALGLTTREREVLDLLVDDVPEPRIADRLGVSPHTVRSHVKNLYGKLHVHSRAQAVRAAIERGLV